MKDRMTATERDSLLMLGIMCDLALGCKEGLARRAKHIRQARSRLGLIVWATRALFKDMCDDIPPEQKRSFLRNLDMRVYTVGVRAPMKDMRREKDFGQWVSWGELNALLMGCHEGCRFCDKALDAQRACPLRKALDVIGSDVPENADGSCPYFPILGNG